MEKKPCDITVLHCARFFRNMWLDKTNTHAIYRTIYKRTVYWRMQLHCEKSLKEASYEIL